nr:hypothetical protein I308_03617 [Cryptococcus tetragattii IND107]
MLPVLAMGNFQARRNWCASSVLPPMFKARLIPQALEGDT